MTNIDSPPRAARAFARVLWLGLMLAAASAAGAAQGSRGAQKGAPVASGRSLNASECQCYEPDGSIVPACASRAREALPCVDSRSGDTCAPARCPSGEIARESPQAVTAPALRLPLDVRSPTLGDPRPDPLASPATLHKIEPYLGIYGRETPSRPPAAPAAPGPTDDATAMPKPPAEPPAVVSPTSEPPAPPLVIEAPNGEPEPPSSLLLTMLLGLAALLTLAVLIGGNALYRRERWLSRAWDMVLANLEVDPDADVATIESRIRQLRAADYDLRRLRQTGLALAPPSPPRAPPQEDGDTLGAMAQSLLRSLPRLTQELAEDKEFASFNQALDLHAGAMRAARALEDCARAGNRDYFEHMHNALKARDFDGVLTSLDVLAAYAQTHPGWLEFLACLEAAETLLTLELLQCGIAVFRPPLMRPLDAEDLVEINIISDARDLARIPSVRRRAQSENLRLSDPAKTLLVDCISPGWRSPRFGDRVAHAAAFDPASMGGAAP